MPKKNNSLHATKIPTLKVEKYKQHVQQLVLYLNLFFPLVLNFVDVKLVFCICKRLER